MSAPLLRDGRDADGPALAALIEAVFGEYPGCPFVPEEFPELSAPASHFASRGGGLLVLADGADRAVGSLAFARVDGSDRFELFKVYLSPGLRGGGHAQRLYGAAAERIRAAGGTRIRLWTDTRFTRGHGFYEKLGFRRLPVTRYLADASRAWEYAYVLDPLP